MSGKQEKEQVYARYVASGKTMDHLASWGKTLAEVMNPEGKPEVLDEVLVLDASLGNFSGIIAASFLAEFGAEVVKIEPPEGDPMRKVTPYGANLRGVGIPFLVEGRNKKYLTLDLKKSKRIARNSPDWPRRLRWSSKPLLPGRWIPGGSDIGN